MDEKTIKWTLKTTLMFRVAGGNPYSVTLIIATSEDAAELADLATRLFRNKLVSNVSIAPVAAAADAKDEKDALVRWLSLAAAYLNDGKAIIDDLSLS